MHKCLWLFQLNADHAARYGDLKRREELARHRLAEVEFELSEAKRKLTKECDVRRQQMTEISMAREKERQEWFRAQERKLNELGQCHQETVQQLRKEHADEIQKIVEGRLGEIEKGYKEQLKQLHMVSISNTNCFMNSAFIYYPCAYFLFILKQHS
ncbi:hypothetical protein P879_11790 [Paragonimus westermani]|uniref:Uncharacterized protein n=1 Tax=Paragonimus westermani TaxID=34504 RepID=A0A8T0D7U5_9TREM|nr:hypothetical protein P879_11790 [Paragonimus westermani]